MLKRENNELTRSLNIERSDLKVANIRYEKLEKAFAESIEKMMSTSS
jgi:hypothetical protein